MQVTVWVATLQLQPVPEAPVTGSDAGTGSVTVTRPWDGLLPALDTDSVNPEEPPAPNPPASVLVITRSGAVTVDRVCVLVSLSPKVGLV